MAIRIRCINNNDRNDQYTRITHIGGQNDDGARWKRTQSQAIHDIETGTYAYFVERPAGDRVNVIVAVSQHGNKYIKTTADGDAPNNLLSLPECP